MQAEHLHVIFALRFKFVQKVVTSKAHVGKNPVVNAL